MRVCAPWRAAVVCVLAFSASVGVHAAAPGPTPTAKAPSPTTPTKTTPTKATPPTTTTTTTPATTTADAPAPAISDAVALEEAAFAAVDEEAWCVAMHLFVQADEAAPAPALLENAANAAEYAGDLERATALLTLLVDREKNAFKKKVRRAAITKLKLRSKGKTGITCPTLLELRPPPEPEPEPAPVEVAVAAPPEPSMSPLVGPIVGGVGVFSAVAGAGLMVVGALPFFDHGRAVAAIEAAEDARGDARGLQGEQQAAREAWESWGQLSMVSGGVLVGLGLTAAVAGGVFVVTQQGSGE